MITLSTTVLMYTAQALAAAPPTVRNFSSPSAVGQIVARADQRGRALSSVTVSNFADLATEVAGSATEIRMDAGTYVVTSSLSISRSVTITADVEGAAVVLDGQGARRVLYISGSGINVDLVGLAITRGSEASVRSSRPIP